MTIIHDEWGEVAGVECQIPQSRWWKQGANYYFGDGWREKVEETWEEVTGDRAICLIKDYGQLVVDGVTIVLPFEFRFQVIERYDLPANWRHQSINEGAENLTTWVEQFKRPCLIIERKV